MHPPRLLYELAKDPKTESPHASGGLWNGKDALLRKLAVTLAHRYLDPSSGSGTPAPIYVDMREFSHVVSLRQIMLDLLDRSQVHLSSYEAFSHVFTEGRIVLLLDGFDELASKSNLQVTLRNFRELNKSALGKAKLILSCRQHYFVDDAQVRHFHGAPEDTRVGPRTYTDLYREIAGRPNFQIGYLGDFDDMLIAQFLRQRHGEAAEAVMLETIKGQYNLQDLARRPVLLEMISDSLQEIVSQSGLVTSAVLYQVYTDIWLERNDWNTTLTPDARNNLIEEFAARASREPDACLHYSEIPRIVRELNPDLSSLEMDQCDRELRRAGFLVRDSGGNYRFSHRSFQEFFLARHVIRSIADATTPDSLNFTRELPVVTSEVFRFVCHSIEGRPDAMSSAIRLLNDPDLTDQDAGFIIKCVSRVRRPDVAAVLVRIIRRIIGNGMQGRSVTTLAFAISALSWTDPNQEPSFFIDLIDRDLNPENRRVLRTPYIVCHNAVLALLRSRHPEAATLLLGAIHAPESVVARVILGSPYIFDDIARENRKDIADAILSRWTVDQSIQRGGHSRLLIITELCRTSASIEAHAIVRQVARRTGDGRVFAAAATMLGDSELIEFTQDLLSRGEISDPRSVVALIPVFERIGTADAVLFIAAQAERRNQGIANAAVEALARCSPQSLLVVSRRAHKSWKGTHWEKDARLRVARLLQPMFREFSCESVRRLLRYGALTEIQATNALRFVAEYDEENMKEIADLVWEKYRSPGILVTACEELGRSHPEWAREMLIKRGLGSAIRSLRQRTCRSLRADISDEVTEALIHVVVAEEDPDVRVEAAHAITTPGRDITSGQVSALKQAVPDPMVLEILDVIAELGASLGPGHLSE